MARNLYPIQVTNDDDAVDDRTVLLPVSTPTDRRPDRAVIFGHDADAPAIVVRMTPRRQGDQNTPGSVTYSLFEKLGGSGTGRIRCQYRRATFWDLIRYDRRARCDASLSLLAAVVAAVVAWLAFDKALSTETGVRWMASAGVFAIGLIVTILKLRKELEDIGP